MRAAIGLGAPLLITAALTVLVPAKAYPWLKAFHLVAAVTWIGGMIGLTHIFAWHARARQGSPLAETLSAIEQRVLQRVVNPAMLVAWGIGLWLGWEGGWFLAGWLQAKLVLVLALSGLHGWVVGAVRSFADGGPVHGPRFYLSAGIAGGAAAVATIVLAVVKPM